MDINMYLRFRNSRVGLNGTLCPNGTFVPCEYGKHEENLNVYWLYIIANKLGLRSRRKTTETMYEFVKRMGFITMGSQGPGKEVFSHIRFEGEDKMSFAQVEWFVAHYKELDEIQQQLLKDYWREVGILVDLSSAENDPE